MKAITICEPYATLLARGVKRVENRTWPAPQSLIGQRIAIHAGKSRQWLSGDNYGIPVAEMSFGKVIATAKLAACVSLLAADRFDASVVQQLFDIGWTLDGFFEHEHTEGPMCWIFTDVEPMTPIAAKGALGVWEWAD